MKLPVVFGEKMVAVSGSVLSPSAHKPRELAEYLKKTPIPGLEYEFVEPPAMSPADMSLAHSEQYVGDVMSLKIPNGFGTVSQSVIDSLPYTNGSMYAASRIATAACPAVALCSGFHHAGYHGQIAGSLFCTFNGLMIAALKLIHENVIERVSIIDCDMHWGNGTDDIIAKIASERQYDRRSLPIGYMAGPIHHVSFGHYFDKPRQAPAYLANFATVRRDILETAKPDLIIYQAGADVHVSDPFGGVLTETEMYQRDLSMFRIANELGIPLAWNLAGGYQVDVDGSIDKILKLHWNTFKACKEVYGVHN